LRLSIAAAHQPSRDVGRLQEGALRRKMGGQISCNGDKDMPALVAIAPLAKLPHPRIEGVNVAIEALEPHVMPAAFTAILYGHAGLADIVAPTAERGVG
jgi:hypothetical protein